MSNTKYILGSFADPDEMMHGIDKLQANNISTVSYTHLTLPTTPYV